MALSLYNSLTRKRDEFKPLDPTHIKMYVCGPTVYDTAHLGNARPVIVFDVLYRLLKHMYPESKVTYVRNITDVDDKIIKASQETGEPIDQLTRRTTDMYHEDMAALHALAPTIEPRATEHIPDMIQMIESLIAKGHAYVHEGHVLFSASSDTQYGSLSRMPAEEIIAGARVEVAPYKNAPQDFILWKPSTDDMPGWESPWGYGRPGWHIECSAMSQKYLGETFDIHGGGIDLVFPHHENECAQSRCAHGKPIANFWMHNGHLTVGGEKMSKSLGNFFTVRDFLKDTSGEVIRVAMLMTHYRQPLNWGPQRLQAAKNILDYFYNALGEDTIEGPEVDEEVLTALQNNLNTPDALNALDKLMEKIYLEQNSTKRRTLQEKLKASAQLLGLLNKDRKTWFQGKEGAGGLLPHEIEDKVNERLVAKKNGDYVTADQIRQELYEKGVLLEDGPGTTFWKLRQ